jgi:hypothetical protein
MTKKNSQEDNYDFGLLSAIWILACNDDAALMLYRSIEFRLGTEETLNLKNLISKHGELFRKKCPESELLKWKQKMLMGNFLPSWIRDIPNENDRKEAINSITVDDVFRSQFRPKLESPTSSIDIINWGLEHLERARKYKIEAREEKWKRWKEVGIPLISIVIALLTVLFTSYWQYENIQAQREIKEYELSFRPRQEGYSKFMTLINNGYELSAKTAKLPDQVKSGNEMVGYFSQLENTYYGIEPFLTEEKRNKLWNKYQEYQSFLFTISEKNTEQRTDAERNKLIDTFLEFKHFFKDELKQGLFNESVVNLK